MRLNPKVSIPNEALQKACVDMEHSSVSGILVSAAKFCVSSQLVQEIESRAIVSQQQIGTVKTQISAK